MRFSFFKKGLVVVIGFIFILLILNFFQKDVKNAFYLVSSPIQKILWSAGDEVSDFWETMREMKNLNQENKELERVNQGMLHEIFNLKEIKKENEILRQAMEIGLEKEFKLIMADIINKDVLQDFLLINKGSQDQISKGMVVISQEKALLGKISEVYKNFSRVMLISNKKSRFSAKIEVQEKKVLGIIQGKGRLLLSFERIPHDKEILKEDVALTDILGGDFPPGLLVGKVKEIQKSDTEPFQQVKISPFFNIEEIEKIFIITQYR